MYKVFFNDNIIFLSDDIKHHFDSDNSLLYPYEDYCNLEIVFKIIENNNLQYDICLFNSNLENIWTNFLSYFKIIEAAGGLVKNNDGHVLIIERYNKWDLPKGKINKNESIKDAAKREVSEECGITNLEITKELQATFHTYRLEEQRILKKTYWFEMKYTGNEELIPQKKENITKAKWHNISELDEVINNTYLSIIDVLKAGKLITFLT
ncbi:MAG: NUDIX domain-containing protein [Bacteroidales bacterium]|nr:NUDIX domain-containing protein [Bacteroidales bacterium]